VSVERDRSARALARTEFERPIVLEAGAGTGKTTALVARVVAWLIDEGFEHARAERRDEDGAAHDERAARRALDGLLAITFTEAAAADMDKKIRAALALVENGGAPVGMEDHVFRATLEERKRRASLLRAALERPIASTIHAWCHALLARHPLEAGLHPAFRLDAEGREVEEVVRTVLTDELRERLSERTDPDWLVLARRDVGPGSVGSAITRLIQEGGRAQDLHSESFPDSVLAAIESELRAAIEAFLEVCPAPAVKPDAKRVPRSAQICGVLSSLLDGLQSSDGTVADVSARTRAAHDALPAKSAAAAALNAYASGDFNVSESKGFAGSQAAITARAAALQPLLQRWCGLDPELERAARRVIERVLSRARVALVREGIQTFGDLMRDAHDLLDRDRDLCARLRRGIDQVLVDEFQDTDPLQCDLVRWIALDAERGRKPGLLIVGDPKQSIYGFRRADLSAYDRFVDEVVAAGGVRAHLTVNFRSGQPILDHVERVVAPHMQRAAGVQPDFVALHAHKTVSASAIEWWSARSAPAPDGTSAVKTSAAAGSRLEARFLAAELLASRDRGLAWSDMAVLMRTSTALDVLLEALRDAGIPFDVTGDKSYYRRREILDAAAVFACVVDPGDHVALLAYLRSPWVGVPDALLIPLWRGSFAVAAGALDRRNPRTLERARELVQRALASMPRDVPGLERIAGFEAALDHGLETLAVLRASWHEEPIDVFLERARLLLLCEASAAARFQGAHRLANLERFFHEIALELETNGGDAQALLRWLRTAIADASESSEARPRDAGPDAVPIMTIHKSKGLEFREVFVVGLQRAGRGRGGAIRPTRIEGGAHVLFGAPSPDWFAHQRRVEERDRAERVRLLYVAMTRAGQRLVLSGIWPPPRKDGEERKQTALLDLLEGTLPDKARAHFDNWAPGGPACEIEGVVYRVTAETGEVAAREAADDAVDVARARADSDRLAAARPSARSRADHVLLVPMSRRILSDDEDGLDEEVPARPVARRLPDVAAVAGTAIHRALELLPLDGDTARVMSGMRSTLPSHVAQVVAATGLVSPLVESEAVALAQSIHDAFVSGAAFAHFERIRAHVIARELPVLDAAAALEGPTVLASGAIDLLYRDPGTGELVVVDYKTGAASGAKSSHHAQMVAYRRALQRALALPDLPRGELWYLATSSVVNVG
jgi:ATP-dependent helicase/nuclease subunit A